MVTFLSGGTGTPKLLTGVEHENIAVVANTGDDVMLGGHLVCPDVDTVMYTAGGVLDRTTWWGIEDDSTKTHDRLHSLSTEADLDSGPRYLSEDAQTSGRDIAKWRRFSGIGEFMEIGDRDRAVHLTRTGLLDEGHTLTEVTRRLTSAFNCGIDIIPMSNDPVASLVHTPNGYQHFQAFWVGHGGEPTVEDVEFRGSDAADTTDAVLEALAEPVVIGPSNPVTSIGPMLAIDPIRNALEQTTVVAVSPFIEETIFSGPAGDLMAGVGLQPSTRGVADHYDFADVFVLDSADSTAIDRPVVSTDTEMTDETDATRVWRACERAFDRVGVIV